MKGNANTKIRKCRKHRATQCLTIKKKIETNEPSYWTPFETSKQKCRQETETKLKTRN